MKERNKVSKYQKFVHLMLKTVVLVKILKTEKLTENVLKFCAGQALMPYQPQSHGYKFIYTLLKFWGILKKLITSVTIFNVKPLNFQHIVILTCSFYLYLNSVNKRFYKSLKMHGKAPWQCKHQLKT